MLSAKRRNISALIFSKDDIAQAFDLISAICMHVSEVVLIDASSRAGKMEMRKEAASCGITNLRVINAIALGYREPLMAFGLSKCQNDWVIQFDTDERPSPRLMSDIRDIVDDAHGVVAFKVQRVDIEPDGRPGFASWEIRLYDRHRISYSGLLHTPPSVSGKVAVLDKSRYFIEQMVNMKHTASIDLGPIAFGKYQQIERYMRLTYSSLNGLVSEARYNKPVIKKLLRLYEAAFRKNPEEELGVFEYMAYYTARDAAYILSRRQPLNLVYLVPFEFKRLKQVLGWLKAPDSEEAMSISRIIRKEGIVKFLQLDDVDNVESLIKRYKGKPQGIALLIHLIKLRYAQVVGPK